MSETSYPKGRVLDSITLGKWRGATLASHTICGGILMQVHSMGEVSQDFETLMKVKSKIAEDVGHFKPLSDHKVKPQGQT